MPRTRAIVAHALKMVFDDFAGTLRAIWVGLAMIGIGTVLTFAISANRADVFLQGYSGQSEISRVETPIAPSKDIQKGGFGAAIVVAELLVTIGYVAVAVAWHRYVLLPMDRRGEGYTPGLRLFLGYTFRCLLLGLVLLVPMVLLQLAIPIFRTGAAGGLSLLSLFVVPCIVLASWICLRLALILPACAIGHSLTLSESWAVSRPLSLSILGLILIFGLATLAEGMIVAAISVPYLSDTISVVISVLTVLISTSVLATLYGVAVEGREV